MLNKSYIKHLDYMTEKVRYADHESDKNDLSSYYS